MKFYKISQDTGQSLIINDLRIWPDVLGPLEDEDVGSVYTITIEDMPEADFHNLPEWDGF